VIATSRGPTATTPLLQRGNGGSIPSGTIGLMNDEDEGPWVCRAHPSFVKRGTEFDSRADLHASDSCDGPRVRRRHASLVRRWTEFESRADPWNP
jgi:hypothetical protein